MKFTVLLNNYNYSRYVSTSIQSVLNQTYPNFELIIVDDGSTDHSRDIISAFTDPRIRVHFKPNGGQGSAFQDGIHLSTGDYIAFLDSDDVWLNNKLESCFATLSAEPNITLYNNAYLHLSSDGDILPDQTVKPEYSGFYDPFPDYLNLEYNLPFRPSSCIVAKASACKRLYLHPDSWRIDADTPLLAGLSVMGSIYISSDQLTLYRIHDSNATRNQSWWDVLARTKRFYDSVSEHLSHQDDPRRFRFEQSKHYINGLVCRAKWYTPRGLIFRTLRLVPSLSTYIHFT